MNLKEQLQEDLKTALKNHATVKLSVIRLVKAAIMNLEIERSHKLDDEEVIGVIAKEVKQRNDSIPEYQKAGREDIVSSLKSEIAILEAYLPAQLSEAEVRELVEEAVRSTGAANKKDMGKVMAVLMPKTRGRADGKLVSQLVSAALEQQ